MLRGPEALKSLDDAVRDIRREEDDISRKLARGGELIAKMRESETDLFRQLAQMRLDPAAHGEIAGRLSEAEARAHDMLARHQQELAAAEDALKTLDRSIADKATERAAALAEVDERAAALRALSDKIADEVARDPRYEEKRRQAEALHDIAEESQDKAAQAEADRDEKGRPYREDPLFMYLWEAGYLTSTYRANNLVRWLDAKVARLVRFADARPNFAMLNEIPIRLREHADAQMARARDAEAELDALENQAIDAAGGRELREALSAAQARIEAIDAEIVTLEDERDEAARTLRQLAQGSDPAFEQAVSALADTLAREDLASLLAQARQTRTAADDAIVAKIDDIRARIAEEEAEARDHKARLKTLATRRRELEDIEWEFKKARYDDPRSTFKQEGLVGGLLDDFLRGAITAGSYWDQWQKSQQWSGTDSWGGGVGLPRGGRNTGSGFQWPGGGSTWVGGTASKPKSSSRKSSGANWGRLPTGSGGGGFSRPRTGSKGNRTGGGFKTGGGF